MVSCGCQDAITKTTNERIGRGALPELQHLDANTKGEDVNARLNKHIRRSKRDRRVLDVCGGNVGNRGMREVRVNNFCYLPRIRWAEASRLGYVDCCE
jgi:hypothetical protein